MNLKYVISKNNLKLNKWKKKAEKLIVFLIID